MAKLSKLNKEMNGRIETAVLGALSTDDLLADYVRAVLEIPVTVFDPESHEHTQSTYLTQTMAGEIRTAVKSAVEVAVLGQREQIEEAVKAALPAHVDQIAAGLTAALMAQVEDRF